MRSIAFRLAAPLELPNRRGIASNRAAGTAKIRDARRNIAYEIISQLSGDRPEPPFKYAAVTIFRHSLQEPDTDNLYASAKDLLDVLQPSGEQRSYGLGIIENDKPSRCELKVRHRTARYRTDQCTRVVIREMTEVEFNTARLLEDAA